MGERDDSGRRKREGRIGGRMGGKKDGGKIGKDGEGGREGWKR